MKFYFNGRKTRAGAFVSAGGERFNESRTGTNWREVVEAEVGDVIRLVDISNTGKHRCGIWKVAENGALGLEIGVNSASGMGYWDVECPVCK